MTYDIIISKLTALFKLLAIVVPTALATTTFVYRTEVVRSMADFMKPAIIESLKEEVKPAVREVLLEDALVTRLDSNQMVEIEGWIVDGQEKAAKALPAIIRREAKTEVYKWATQTYKVYDFYTGDYLYEETGVKTDTGWIILQKGQL